MGIKSKSFCKDGRGDFGGGGVSSALFPRVIPACRRLNPYPKLNLTHSQALQMYLYIRTMCACVGEGPMEHVHMYTHT